MSERRIPLSDLTYGAEEEAAVQRVLASRWLSSGPEVAAFESEFRGMVGTKHAIAVANGTAALHLAYLAVGLERGDEVIQPAINFVAAANMAIALGCVPVFADINAVDEPTISIAQLESLVTPRSRALVVMHYGGYPCRMAEIVDFCRRHDLALIEDACHAVGARYLDPQQRPPHGAMAGALGDVGCFSFFSNKNLAVGEGGMIVTDRDDIADKVRLLRSHGMTSMSWDRHRGHASSYDVVVHGFNYRLDELRAALGRAQLAKLPANNRRRGELVRLYRGGLSDLRGWHVPWAGYEGDSAYHLMVVVAPDGRLRDLAVRRLTEAGIQTSLHYPCVADFAAFGGTPVEGLSLSRSYAGRSITLPLFPGLTDAQVEEVVSIIRDCAD